jgi:hypothetical protein
VHWALGCFQHRGEVKCYMHLMLHASWLYGVLYALGAFSTMNVMHLVCAPGEDRCMDAICIPPDSVHR